MTASTKIITSRAGAGSQSRRVYHPLGCGASHVIDTTDGVKLRKAGRSVPVARWAPSGLLRPVATAASSATAASKVILSRQLRIVADADGSTFTVADGEDNVCICASREFAERILHALEAAS